MSSAGEDEQARADVSPSTSEASTSAGATADKPEGTQERRQDSSQERCEEQRLEWQSELDSALTDLDTRLRHPRRRSSDVAAQPTLPQLGQFDVTNELLDEIAWRVSEQMKRAEGGAAPRAAGMPIASPPPAPPLPAREAIPEGTAIVIRLRRPLFSWKFWRRRSRRREAMMTFSDYRVT
jgi:hypothetical protein